MSPLPAPMAGKNLPVDWMFAFKFDAPAFPGCTVDRVTPVVGSKGIFGGNEGVFHFSIIRQQGVLKLRL